MIRKSLLVAIALLALALAIPGALCAMPPPGPPWPEEEWNPMSPEDARPKLPDGSPMRLIRPWWTVPRDDVPPEDPRHDPLYEGQAFYLQTGWKTFVMNIAWDAETGEPVVPYESIQGRTSCATAIYDVLTMNGEPLTKPTYSYHAICRWVRFYNDPEAGFIVPPWPEEDWAVAPLMEGVEHYYVFPNGLPAGTYDFYVHMICPGFEDWSATGHLTVSSVSTTP